MCSPQTKQHMNCQERRQCNNNNDDPAKYDNSSSGVVNWTTTTTAGTTFAAENRRMMRANEIEWKAICSNSCRSSKWQQQKQQQCHAIPTWMTIAAGSMQNVAETTKKPPPPTTRRQTSTHKSRSRNTRMAAAKTQMQRLQLSRLFPHALLLLVVVTISSVFSIAPFTTTMGFAVATAAPNLPAALAMRIATDVVDDPEDFERIEFQLLEQLEENNAGGGSNSIGTTESSSGSSEEAEEEGKHENAEGSDDDEAEMALSTMPLANKDKKASPLPAVHAHWWYLMNKAGQHAKAANKANSEEISRELQRVHHKTGSKSSRRSDDDDQLNAFLSDVLVEVPKKRQPVRRCGTLLIKHIQTVCNGCLRSASDADPIIMAKRDNYANHQLLETRSRWKREAGFSKITDICCTQRACADEELKPYCC